MIIVAKAKRDRRLNTGKKLQSDIIPQSRQKSGEGTEDLMIAQRRRRAGNKRELLGFSIGWKKSPMTSLISMSLRLTG
jgi:hypothetical protein